MTPTFIMSSGQTAARLEASLNTLLLPVLNGLFFDARTVAMDAPHLNGTELFAALSYLPAAAPIATPYRARVLEAKNPQDLQDACNAFVAANPAAFISEALATRYVASRRISSYTAILFYNAVYANGAANWGVPGTAVPLPPALSPRIPISTYNGNQVLPDAPSGYLRYTGPGSHIWTLPAASANFIAGAGSVLTVAHRGLGNLTVQCAGLDTLLGSTSLVLLPTQVVDFVATSASTWEIK